MLHVINHSELPLNWNWLAAAVPDPRLAWRHASMQAWPGLQRLPGGALAARLGAAAHAVTLARRDPGLLVSHGPRPAFFASLLGAGRRPTRPHLAFSFNFTELPPARKIAALARAYRRVDRFTVFSTLERELYARVFDLDPARVDMLHWAVRPHRRDSLARPVPDGPYLCAVGSQGRDYRVLLAAMARLPQVRLHLVALPENLAGLAVPDNVTVHQRVPFDFAAALVAHADAMILPLAGAQVPCGHVTAVMAMHLGVPVLATDSAGLHDYLRQGDTATLFQPDSAGAVAEAVTAFLDDPAPARAWAGRAQAFAGEHCVEARTVDYFRRYVGERFGFTPATGTGHG